MTISDKSDHVNKRMKASQKRIKKLLEKSDVQEWLLRSRPCESLEAGSISW